MFWDNVAGVYDLFADIFNKETHKALIAAVSSRITPDDAVLECACGTGLLTGAIAKRCRTLLATDFSANMLKRAKKKYGALPNVTFRQADILHLDEPDGQFDVVIAANVIHLLDEPYKAPCRARPRLPQRRHDHRPDLYEPQRAGQNERLCLDRRQGGRGLQASVHVRHV